MFLECVHYYLFKLYTLGYIVSWRRLYLSWKVYKNYVWHPEVHSRSVIKSCLTLCDPHGLQHARLPCPSLSLRVCSDSRALSRWCSLTISSSAALFSFCLRPFPASESFPMTQIFTSGGQSIGASASVLPVKFQGWFLLGLTGLILQSRGLSRVFSSSTIWKHQFCSTQSSLWSTCHIH